MDKRYLWIVAGVTLSLLGGAGRASARVVSNNHFKGQIAVVACSSQEAIVCDAGFAGSIQRDIFVSGEEFVLKSMSSPKDSQSALFVTIVQSNSCTDESSASFGSLANASQQSLQSASLQGVVPLRDFDDGSPAGFIAVDVSMQGFGAVQRDRLMLRFDFEDPDGTTIVISVRFKGKSRSATASGTLLLNGSPVACTFGEGSLMDTKNGEKTLERP